MRGHMNNVLASAIQAASVRLINRNWFKLDEDTQAQTDRRVNVHQQTDRQTDRQTVITMFFLFYKDLLLVLP